MTAITHIGNAIYVCKYFDIRELVPRHVYADRGESAWELLDRAMLITLDTLREDFGIMHVNTWMWNKDEETLREWSGLRTDQSPVGSIYSQHRYGRAADPIFIETGIYHVRTEVIENKERYPFIKAIEMGVPWFHYDTRNCSGLKTFYP